jgi:hypothetical protein
MYTALNVSRQCPLVLLVKIRLGGGRGWGKNGTRCGVKKAARTIRVSSKGGTSRIWAVFNAWRAAL